MRSISLSLSLFALLSITGHAAPPSGSPCMANPSLPECVWWHAQVNDATNSPCCGGPGQDGHVLTQWSPGSQPKEDDWRVVSTLASGDGFAPSGYQVWIHGGWRDVPNRAMTRVRGIEPDMDRRYRAKGWWALYADLAGTVWVTWFCFEGPVQY